MKDTIGSDLVSPNMNWFVMKRRLPLRRTLLSYSLALLGLLLAQWRPESGESAFSCQKTSSQTFFRHRDDTYKRTRVSGVSWFSCRTWNSRRAWRSLENRGASVRLSPPQSAHRFRLGGVR